MKNLIINNEKLCPIGIGTSGYGGYFERDTSLNGEKYLELLRYAYELGANFIDTAESYADGLSEEIVGKLPDSIKGNMFIATKFSPENCNARNIRKSLEHSLRRLKRDWVDLYMPHWPSPSADINEVIDTLNELHNEGKINNVGLSNFTFAAYAKLKKKSRVLNFAELEYNPFERFPEIEYLDFLKSTQATLIAYSPFRRGELLLPGSKGFLNLSPIAAECKCTVSQLILAWIIRSGNVIAIPKSSNKARILENIEATKVVLNDRAIEDIDKIFPKQAIINLDASMLVMRPDGDRKIYYTLDDAIKNVYNIKPGPLDIVDEIIENNGALVRPLKVKKLPDEDLFEVCEGRLRYWACVHYFGIDCKIPVIILS